MELEAKMKDWPGGTHMVMEGTSPFHNKPLLAIGYKYNSRKVLCFLATKNAGSTRPGEPYRARFKDDLQNSVSRPVARPKIISQYFKMSNCVDKHNHVRQFELRLEKFWVTQNCWFRIFTTILGMTVTDCWKAYCHKFSQPNKKCTIVEFADMLAFELINNKYDETLQDAENIETIPLLRRSPRLNNNNESNLAPPPRIVNRVLYPDGSSEAISPVTHPTGSDVTRALSPNMLWKHFKALHSMEKTTLTASDGRARRWICKECQRQTSWLCTRCNLHLCIDNQGNRGEKCYSKHILKKHSNVGLSIP
jgi:hypothetical protein